MECVDPYRKDRCKRLDPKATKLAMIADFEKFSWCSLDLFTSDVFGSGSIGEVSLFMDERLFQFWICHCERMALSGSRPINWIYS